MTRPEPSTGVSKLPLRRLRDASSGLGSVRAREELVAVVLPRMKAKYGSWKAFDYFAAKEIAFMADELEGKKRTPIPVAD